MFELLLQHCLERHHLFSIPPQFKFQGRVRVKVYLVCCVHTISFKERSLFRGVLLRDKYLD